MVGSFENPLVSTHIQDGRNMLFDVLRAGIEAEIHADILAHVGRIVG